MQLYRRFAGHLGVLSLVVAVRTNETIRSLLRRDYRQTGNLARFGKSRPTLFFLPSSGGKNSTVGIQMNTTSDSRSLKLPIIVGVLASAVIGLVFIVPTMMVYAGTPPDALKVVGYFFITLYGATVGVTGGLACAFLFHGLKIRDQGIKKIILILLSLISGVASILLFASKFQTT
jgi:hypothetical protein